MNEARRRVTRLTVGFVTAILLLAGAGAWWLHSRADRALAEMEARLAELQREVKGRNSSRPVLRGEPVPGNACDDYMAATRAYPKQGPPNWGQIQAFLESRPGSSEEDVRRFMKDIGPALDLVQAGTHRAEVRHPLTWNQGFHALPLYQMNAMLLGDSGRLRARFLRAEGKTRDALEVLLDIAQYARDLHQNSSPAAERWGRGILQGVIGDLKNLLLSGALGEGELRDLDRELAVLDGGWPDRLPTLRNAVAILGTGLANEERTGSLHWGGPQERFMHSWRWAFSSRLRVSSTFERAEFWAGTEARIDGLGWSEAKDREDILQREVAHWPEAIVRYVDLGVLLSQRGSRDVLARLRLLRVAVHYAATGEVMSLADPFNGTLHARVDSGRLKAWSVGPEGVSQIDSQDGSPGSDLVVEVKR